MQVKFLHLHKHCIECSHIVCQKYICKYQIRPGKHFGSVQLIFENWSGGPVDFFIHKPKFSKFNKCQHADMVADAEVATWRCQVLDAR